MEQILISNFKAIVNANAVPIQIKPMTVLMGEQASGKSTVAKLIYFFKTIQEEITFELIENNTITPDNCNEIITNRIRRYFVFLFGSTRHLSSFSIDYTFQNGKKTSIKQNPIGNLHIKTTGLPQILKEALKSKEMLDTYQNSFNEFEQRERNRIIKNIGQKIRGFFGNDQNTLFLPASRNMTVMLENHLTDIYAKLENTIALSLDLSDTNRFQSENELILLKFLQYVRFLRSKFQRAGSFEGLLEDELMLNPTLNTAQAKQFITRVKSVLKGDYGSDQYGEKINFVGGHIYLQNASSGQQESIRTFQDIFLHVLYADPIFRVIEEPESHLFASAQKHLIEALAILANTNPKNQLVITTHSTFILRVLDNLLKAAHLNSPEVEPIIEKKAWIQFDDFSAYNLINGEIEMATNQEVKGVDARLFDDVTDQISNEFDELLNIQYS